MIIPNEALSMGSYPIWSCPYQKKPDILGNTRGTVTVKGPGEKDSGYLAAKEKILWRNQIDKQPDFGYLIQTMREYSSRIQPMVFVMAT